MEDNSKDEKREDDQRSNQKEDNKSNKMSKGKPIEWIRGWLDKITKGVIVNILIKITLFLFAATFAGEVVGSLLLPYTTGILPVKVEVRMKENVVPGSSVELFPLGIEEKIGKDGRADFEEIRFGNLKNKNLEVRVGNDRVKKTVFETYVNEAIPLVIYTSSRADTVYTNTNKVQ